MLKIAALLLAIAAPAAAGPYEGSTLSTTTGRESMNLSGTFGLAASSKTPGAYNIMLDGPTGGVNASSFTAKYGIKAATITATGAITAGSFVGDGSGLTNIALTNSTNTYGTATTNQIYGSSLTIAGGLFGTINHSTQTILVIDFAGTTVIGNALANSSVTLVAQAVPLRITFSGAQTTANGGPLLINVLMDGHYIDSFSETKPMSYYSNGTSSAIWIPVHIDYTTNAVTAGSHIFSVTTGGNGDSSLGCTRAPCVLKIKEDH